MVFQQKLLEKAYFISSGRLVVRIDHPDHSSQNENFTFNQNYPVESVRSQIACTEEMVFQRKLLEKSVFHYQNDWSGYGPAGQFWHLESVLSEIGLLVKQLSMFSTVFGTFLCPHWLRREITVCHFLSRMWTNDEEFIFFLSNLDIFLLFKSIQLQ